MKKWEKEAVKLASRILGAKGGKSKSKAKTEAARKNGKKGGRPRKKKGSSKK